MQQVILSVKDTAAQAFGRPMFLPTAAVGVRSFRDEVNRVDANNEMNKHPDDFELYELGIYDDSTGIIEVCTPRLVARAKDLKDAT